MKRVFMIIIAGCLSFMIAPAQVMTMDECMQYAVEHSITVGKQENVLDNAKMNYKQSVAALFPSVSAGVSASTNFGRSIDPETNNYTTVSTFGNSYSLSASMPIFAGLRYINSIRAAKVARDRGYSDLQIARDRVAMEVMRFYSDVVYYKGAVAIAEEHLSASRKMLYQAKKLYELGRKSAAENAEVLRQGLETIHTTSDRLMQFVDSFRSITRIPLPKKEPLYLLDLLNEACALTVYGKVKLSIAVDPEDTMIYADRGQLLQVILNLVNNALEACSTRDGEQWIQLRSHIAPDESVRIEVSNSGGAIPADVAANIFTPFFTTKHDGAGIGLAVSKQIIRLHGATLTLSHNSDERVTFLIVLE